MLSLVLVSLLVAALLAWLLLPAKHGTPLDPIEPPDQAELEAAERELRDADSSATPKEVDDPDWGPGAPR